MPFDNKGAAFSARSPQTSTSKNIDVAGSFFGVRFVARTRSFNTDREVPIGFSSGSAANRNEPDTFAYPITQPP